MSQPEIHHRCKQCGAAAKPGELFCAQCGNALNETPPEDAAVTGEVPPVTSVEPEPEAPASVTQEVPQAKAVVVVAPESRKRVGRRVNKVRRASNVVLDEAKLDPSLRFILVVGVLFLLFIILLLLSKWIT